MAIVLKLIQDCHGKKYWEIREDKMSETVHYTGTLTEIPIEVDIDTTCRKLLESNGEEILPVNYDYLQELLYEKFDEKYYISNENPPRMFKVKSNEENDAEGVYHAHRIDDKTIGFEIKYYNGGASMSEALCDRRCCDNIMCNRYSWEYGHICNECFAELSTRHYINIEMFMQEEERHYNQSIIEEIERIFPKQQ
jgi:hypothetical protein